MGELRWPDRWQAEAIAAAAPYVDTDHRLDIWVGDPETSLSGTRIAGYLYTDESGDLTMIHDHSGRPGVYPWPPLTGPVLLVKLLRPRRPAVELYRHPRWPKSPTHP